MKITDLETAAELQAINWRDYADQCLALEDLQHVAARFDRFWSCDPQDPEPYHAQWSSGLCSADFFDLKTTMELCVPFRYLVGNSMVMMLDEVYPSRRFDVVIGSASGTTKLARAIADITGKEFAEMFKPEGTKDQLWKEGQPPLEPGKIVLRVEELTSTWSTPPRVNEGIKSFHPGQAIPFVPYLPCAVDRRMAEEYEKDPIPMLDGSQALFLARFESKLYQPGRRTCPMCAQGSTPVRPREGDNWTLLHSEWNLLSGQLAG